MLFKSIAKNDLDLQQRQANKLWESGLGFCAPRESDSVAQAKNYPLYSFYRNKFSSFKLIIYMHRSLLYFFLQISLHNKEKIPGTQECLDN